VSESKQLCLLKQLVGQTHFNL